MEEGGAFASILLQGLDPAMPEAEIRLATELVYGCLRFRFHDEHLLASFSGRRLREIEPEISRIFRLAAHQVLRLDRIPERAAVHEAVSMARAIRGGGSGGKRDPGPRGEARARFMNAILRRLCNEKERLPLPDLPSKEAPVREQAEALRVRHSHPAWIIRRWIEQAGRDGAEALLQVNNRPAPVTVRVDPERMNRDDAVKRLAVEGVIAEPSPVAPEFLRVIRGAPWRTELFREGALYIQDEASGMVAGLLRPEPGSRILDACAAPGGKTLVLSGAVGTRGTVVAADRHPSRLHLVRSNLERASRCNVHLLAADMTKPPLAGPFDGILVDAPCSGSGVFRRDVESRYRLAPEDLPALARRQRAILDATAPLLRKEGRLLYAACSIEPEEGSEVIEGFLADNADFRREDLARAIPERPDLFDDEGCFRSFPHLHDMDGFFAAAITRL